MAHDRIARSSRPRPDDVQVSHGTCPPLDHGETALQAAIPAQPDALTGEPPPGEAQARTPDGRFRDGYSGNPRGRPPKPKATSDTVLGLVLDEVLPNNTSGQAKHISMREALIRSVCVKALRDPRIALALLKLEAMRRDVTGEAEEPGTLLAEEDAALEAYVARAGRRSPRLEEGS